MTDQQQNEISNENRNMWIAVGVIVVLLAGGMGINALVHKEPMSAETVQSSGSSN
jgi:flagellar basal body-associated protein FliL